MRIYPEPAELHVQFSQAVRGVHACPGVQKLNPQAGGRRAGISIALRSILLPLSVPTVERPVQVCPPM